MKARLIVAWSWYTVWVLFLLVFLAANRPGPAPPRPYVPSCNAQILRVHYEPNLLGKPQGFYSTVLACPGPDENYDPAPLVKAVELGEEQ